MLKKINTLEKIAQRLEPNRAERHELNRKVEAYTDGFLDRIDKIKAYNSPDESGNSVADFGIRDSGRSMEEIIEILRDHVDLQGINPASGGHLGYIPGGGVYPSALGDYLADVYNQYAGLFFAGPGAVRMENMLIRWMNKMIGFPETAHGNLTSGGSIANLIAIVTARDAKYIKAAHVTTSVIYLTAQVHHSIQKAVRIGGLDEAIIRYVPVDDGFRMDVGKLKTTIEADQQNGLNPFLIVASAGTTDTGVIDPLNDIAKVAQQYNCWFHVDAAYGGFFILVEEVSERFSGIEKADSVTIDPHKSLFLPYGSGAVLVKDVQALEKTHVYHANYMQDAIGDIAEPSPCNLSPELTKHFRGLRMWLPLQLMGLEPFKAALSEKIWLTRFFYEEIQKLGFEVGAYPELSVMIYRYVPEGEDANAFNAKLIEMVKKDGRVFLSSTTIKGVFWLRLAVVSFRTHLSTVELCLKILKNAVAKLSRKSMLMV